MRSLPAPIRRLEKAINQPEFSIIIRTAHIAHCDNLVVARGTDSFSSDSSNVQIPRYLGNQIQSISLENSAASFVSLDQQKKTVVVLPNTKEMRSAESKKTSGQRFFLPLVYSKKLKSLALNGNVRIHPDLLRNMIISGDLETIHLYLDSTISLSDIEPVFTKTNLVNLGISKTDKPINKKLLDQLLKMKNLKFLKMPEIVDINRFFNNGYYPKMVRVTLHYNHWNDKVDFLKTFPNIEHIEIRGEIPIERLEHLKKQ